jgi:8-oxo-dGTP pyrophosphatase MutT (NUDIX family)
MITLNQIQEATSAHQPILVESADGKRRASVALILHPAVSGLQLLFIVRAEKKGDPWSGHIAFPGGGVEPDDKNNRQTAERETKEETNLDLAKANYLGQLDDVTGTTLKIVVSGFVYHVGFSPDLKLNYELRDFHWIPIETLLDPNRQKYHRFQFEGFDGSLPAIDILGPQKPILWGLTYRLVGQLLQLVGQGLPGLS